MPKASQFRNVPPPGQKFGKLTVLAVAEPILEGKWRCAASLCKCECGKELVIRNYVLNRSRHPVQSCGCTRKHGRAQRAKMSRTYRAWCNMKTRCRRDPRYSSRQIAKEWKLSFERFLQDMGECPEGLSLDRIDNTKGYEPGNCRWASVEEQQNNKSNNVRITFEGTTKTIRQWMRYHGLNETTFYRRLKLGWSKEDAAGRPKGYRIQH